MSLKALTYCIYASILGSTKPIKILCFLIRECYIRYVSTQDGQTSEPAGSLQSFWVPSEGS